MIYMVELALLDAGRRAERDPWYVAHQHRLLSIPGSALVSGGVLRDSSKSVEDTA